MTLIELEHDSKYKQYSATVKLSYEEIASLYQGIYRLCKDEENKTKTAYHETHKEIALLFELIKHGHLDGWSISKLNNLQQAITDSIPEEAK